MSSAMILAQLTAAIKKLEEAQAAATAGAQAASEAKTLVGTALQGSASGPLVAMIDQVRENLVQASGRIEPAKSKVNETIARVAALGN